MIEYHHGSWLKGFGCAYDIEIFSTIGTTQADIATTSIEANGLITSTIFYNDITICPVATQRNIATIAAQMYGFVSIRIEQAHITVCLIATEFDETTMTT